MIPPRPPHLPQVGDALVVEQSGHSYSADVDHRTGQYVHVAQLRFHVLDDWLPGRQSWCAQPGNAFVALP